MLNKLKRKVGVKPQLRQRPKDLKVGDVWDQSITEILEGWTSCDGAGKWRNWDQALASKRRDRHYPKVVESIQKYGFVRPVTAATPHDYVKGGYEELQYGDGHHRLAAAIDLGYTHIPMQYTGSNFAVSHDSGSGTWLEGKVPTENPISRWEL